jgi:hypothetical protein
MFDSPNSARTEYRTALEQSTEQSLEQLSNQPTAYRQQPETQNQKNQPATPETTATLPTPLSALPPRAREAVPAAPAWNKETALEIKRERWSKRRQPWIKEQGQVDFSVHPGCLQWLSYCRAVHPSWQEKSARKAFDTLSLNNWSQGGRKVDSWWQVADAWADNADHTEHFEAFMDGSMGLDTGALSASAAGITKGEAFS